MGTSLTLFRIFDINVRIHWSFFLILIYGAFAYSRGSEAPLSGALYGVLVILLLFLCVTLHEFGHALVARHFKVKVPNITLLPIGGVASLEKIPEEPKQEFLIAIAGPIVNIVIALLLAPFALVAYTSWSREAGLTDIALFTQQIQQPGLGNLLVYLSGINLVLALFNLLPAFPMDGGRILRALLAMTMPYVDATRIAVTIGRLMAILFAIWGLFNNTLLLLVAFFVYIGGTSEREAVESRAVLQHKLAGDALTPAAHNLYSSQRLDRVVELIMNSYQTDYPVLDLSGKFIGVLTRARLIRGLKDWGADSRVVDAMIPATQVPVCASTATLDIVWEKITRSGSRVVAVIDGNHFLGLITIDDITEVFQVLGATRGTS